MLVDQELGADAMTVFVRLECELPSSSSSAKELLEALSEPSAAGVPHTPSANSNSASTALPLLLPTLSPSSSSSASSNPRLVLQVTHADMCLPGDAPHLEGLCSRTVGLPVKDMMREELDQEQELDEDRNLDLDLDIGDEDRIIGRIQVREFLPLRLLSEADALLPQDFIDENDDIFRAKDREQKTASSGPSTTASSRSTSTTNRQFAETPHTSSLTAVPPAHPRTFCSCFLRTQEGQVRLCGTPGAKKAEAQASARARANHRCRRRRGPIYAEEEVRQKMRTKQPDRRRRLSASRRSSDTFGASCKISGALQRSRSRRRRGTHAIRCSLERTPLV
ncbi:hypothetical protein EDB84DRAFT_873687 [Lactarius hengduanensis]|nr:hypothetical protein EDB84DRAFT_873687 [Lactarius hengduanensis]